MMCENGELQSMMRKESRSGSDSMTPVGNLHSTKFRARSTTLKAAIEQYQSPD